GLFGSTAGSAEIMNLELLGANISADGSNVGILIGYMQEGTIHNCYVEGTITNTNNSFYTGGLVGRMDSQAEVGRSHSNVDIFGSRSVGGLVG
ncbi:GLUG motif-containing protein, partial [Chryseobacterium sp. SIMBA_029]